MHTSWLMRGAVSAGLTPASVPRPGPLRLLKCKSSDVLYVGICRLCAASVEPFARELPCIPPPSFFSACVGHKVRDGSQLMC